MERQEDKIREELINLIKDSCDFEERPKLEYQKFHKSFLKFSFAALDVEVDYETKSICVWNSKPTTGNALELYNYKEALFEKVNYTDLEETLMGCIESGIFNERFYKHLLYDLDRIKSNDGMKTA